jgi:hypothetical protein
LKTRILSRTAGVLCLAVGLLALTATSASALRTLTPTSFTFPDAQVGLSSGPTSFVLNVSCHRDPISPGDCLNDDNFSPSISTIGEFTQTNNCPPLMAGISTPGVSCTIMVTFRPKQAGQRFGTLSTGTGGPTAQLRGTALTVEQAQALKKKCKRKKKGSKKSASAAKKKRGCKKRKKKR